MNRAAALLLFASLCPAAEAGWQVPGEIQVPTGPWQVPGDIQVPKGIQAVKEGSGVVRVTVQDDASPVRRLELSIDAGPWEDVHPEDGIADSTNESYRISVPVEPRGRRLVVVRASDILGNASTARVDVP